MRPRRRQASIARIAARTIRPIVVPGDAHPALRNRTGNEHSLALAREWKRLGRAATATALLTSPILFVALLTAAGWAWYWAALGALGMVVVFRGAVDVLAHKLIPSPTIYGAESELRRDDVISRRRLWYWRKKFRRAWWLFVVLALATGAGMIARASSGGDASIGGGVDAVLGVFETYLPLIAGYAPILVLLFAMNFLILLGPMLFLGIQQIKAYEPGDADWGRQARRRSRAARGQGRDHARRVPLAVRRGVREGGRQARARGALPRPARHRQDDALQGDRHVIQLPVRHGAGLGLRRDVHRHRRDPRALPGAQGQEAGREVGRPVHRVHRRDRRGRAAPPGAAATIRPLPGPRDPRPPVLRAHRRADARRRPGDRVARLARADVRAARRTARRGLPGGGRAREGRDRSVHDPGHGRHGGLAGAQPAARGDGRHRRAAAEERRSSPTGSTRSSTRSTSSRSGSAR